MSTCQAEIITMLDECAMISCCAAAVDLVGSILFLLWCRWRAQGTFCLGHICSRDAAEHILCRPCPVSSLLPILVLKTLESMPCMPFSCCSTQSAQSRSPLTLQGGMRRTA